MDSNVIDFYSKYHLRNYNYLPSVYLMEVETLDETLNSTNNEEKSIKETPRRLASIDFIKGVAIIMIILAHSSGAWFSSEWVFIHGIVYIFLDILGPSLFIFLSALSVVFSIERKKGRLPEKVIRNNIFARGSMLILVGALINLVLLADQTFFPFTLWGWNIIFFLGFSQIFCYYALKLRREARVVVGLIIIISSELIREYIWDLYQLNNPIGNILFFLIDSYENTVTFLPWVSICFITTIFGEFLYEAMMDGSDKAYKRLLKIFIIYGMIFTFLGIISGFNAVNLDSINGGLYRLYLLNIANGQPFVHLTGIWKFLIRGTASNMFYNIGTSLLVMAFGFYLTDIKKKDNIFISLVKFYGKVSLNLFLAHYIFLPLFMTMLPIWYFPFMCLAYEAFLGFLFYFWMKYANYVGTPEWIMGQVLTAGKKKK